MSRGTSFIQTWLLAASTVVLVFASPSLADDYVLTLQGNRPALPAATHLSEVPQSTPLTVTVGLGWRNQTELEQLLRELAAPQSPRYEQYLSSEEFDAQFAPTTAEVGAIVAHLEASGFAVTRISSDRMLITAVGTAAAADSAFGTRLLQYADETGSFFLPETDPRLPGDVGSRVVSIGGLENRVELHPQSTLGPPAMTPRGGNAPYSPGDIAAAYDFTPLYQSGIRGSASRASTIAVITAYGFDPTDLAGFWQAFSIDRSASSVEVVPVGGTVTGLSDETTLDVQWASAMAPQSPIVVYEGVDSGFSTFLEMYDRAVSDNRAAVISTSWGACEAGVPKRYLDQADAIFQKAAALGISVVAASGDSGAYDCGPGIVSVDFPASHPLVTAVGGTSLWLTADGSYGTESAWSESGGGSSAVWPQPLWQAQDDDRRALADVAFNADPSTGYYVQYQGQWWQFGGTSVGAPCWAALLALANQQREEGAARTTIGLPAPKLCDLVDQGADVFRDVTKGRNEIHAAGAGWDYLTGWGTPDAKRLADALTYNSAAAHVDGGPSISTYISGGSFHGPIARAQFTSRCANSQLELHLNMAPAGAYDLLLDDQVIDTLTVGSDGQSSIQVPTVDPRGHMITLAAHGASQPLLRSRFPQTRQRALHLQESFDLVTAGLVRGVARYRTRYGLGDFSVRVYGLPATDYNLIVGQRRVATLYVRQMRDQTIGTIRFESRPRRGPALDFDPLCQTIQVTRKATVHLRIDAFGAERGLCAP